MRHCSLYSGEVNGLGISANAKRAGRSHSGGLILVGRLHGVGGCLVNALNIRLAIISSGLSFQLSSRR